jgi:hypothetical protein
MTALHCSGDAQATAGQISIMTSPAPSSIDGATPHTIAADMPTSSCSRRTTCKHQRETAASFLSPLPPYVKHIDSHNGSGGRQAETSLPLTSPRSPLPPSHRYLLEVIQQQQQRIVALQTSLLYATEMTQWVSHSLPSKDTLGDAMSTAVASEAAVRIKPPSSLLVSPIAAEHLTAAPLSETRATAVVSLAFADKEENLGTPGIHRSSVGSVALSSTEVANASLDGVALARIEHLDAASTDTTQEVQHDEQVIATAVADDSKVESCERLGESRQDAVRPDDHAVPRGPPLRSSAMHTADSPVTSAPRTHRILNTSLTQEDRTASHDNDIDVTVEAAEHVNMTSGSGDGNRRYTQRALHSMPTAASHAARDNGNDELVCLQRRLEELSAAHLRLRVRCAREACERRETSDGLRAMMGCVHAALDDAVQGGAQPVPQAVVSVLEYVLRQCSRSLLALDEDTEVPSLPSPGNGTHSGHSTGPSTRSPSPARGAPRNSATPGIILHRLRDRMYM